MRPDAVPEPYHSITPYLLVSDVDAFLDFAARAFGSTVKERLTDGEGVARHAEVFLGDSVVMVGAGPDGAGGAVLYHYVPDADAACARAVEAGASVFQEATDQFYGDRTAAVNDPFGNQWWLATRQETLSSDEMQRRMHDARG